MTLITERIDSLVEELIDLAADDNFSEWDLHDFLFDYRDEFPSLVIAELLHHPDDGYRWAAAAIAGGKESIANFWVLRWAQLHTEDSTVRVTCCWAMRRIDEPLAIWIEIVDAMAAYCAQFLPKPGEPVQLSLFEV